MADSSHTPGSAPSSAAETLIGPGARFEGLVSFSGSAAIAGEHRGDVVGVGTLHIEAGGSVIGRIEVDELILAGEVEGEIHAATRAEFASTARARGRIHAGRLAIAEGCVIEGRCCIARPPEMAPSAAEGPLQRSVAAPQPA